VRWSGAPGARETLAPMLRWLTAGESHGPSLVAILEGLPAHVRLTTADLDAIHWLVDDSVTAAVPG
jgi:hypothetical protein